MVTPDVVSDVLRVSRVEHPDYPSCERLRIVSKDELMSAFCERPLIEMSVSLLHVRPLLKVLDS